MKKILSFIMAVIMAFGSVAFGETAEVFASDEISVMSKNMTHTGYFIYGSTETQPLRTKIDYYVDNGGTERMAYCIEPLKNGVSEIGTYSVDATSYSNDPVIWGILLNGYPNKSIEELGVSSEFDAYYMTKMALWMHIQYNKMGSWRAVDSNFNGLLDKTKQLYEKGKTYTSINKSQYVITPETTQAIDDGNYKSQIFTVTSDTASKAFTVVLDGKQPSGTKITDISGTEKNTFDLGEKFKVSVFKDKILNNGTFNFTIDGDLKTCLVLKGIPNDNIKQAYALQTEFSAESAKGTVSYKKTPEITEPPEKTPNTIQIFKLEAGTKIPLAGAEFKITDADGGVIGHFYSDGNGQVTVPVTEGTYYVDEITPPVGYELDKITHKDIIVRKDEPAIVTFENHKEPSLEVLKVDSDTNEPLSGATIRIMEEGSYKSYDEITDTKGTARFEGLKSGIVYRVKEVVPPEHYIVDSTCENIILNAGELHKITIKNKKKPSLTILKYDELTSKPLDGAEFSVAKKGGQILWEGIVPNGEMILEDLPEDWLTVTELAAPKGYLKRDESKDVYLEKGGTVTVKFDNRLRPSLQILKVDNNLQPLEGVKYKVTKLEDKTVSEYFTDAMGQIIIYDLDEAIYKVEELSTLDTHIIDIKPKEIQLEWGKQKTLLFKNFEKPKLEILKIDSVTKEPIKDTKFQVKKIEASTVSEYLTDKDGRIFIENLEEGIYQVLETVANSEYILHNEHKEIELKGGDNKTLIFENDRKPTLIITKINALTQKGIPNTTFKIEYEQTSGGIKNLGTFKTDSNGRIIVENAAVGWHMITETIPAQGMQLPSNPVTRKYLSAGENAYLNDTPNNDGNANNGSGADTGQNTNIEVKSGHDYVDEQGKIITNFPLNALVIKKNDAITSEMLEGAVFEVRKIDGQLSGTSGTIIGRYTTDSSGIIVITGLEAGGYIVEEVKSPTNYLISENSKQTTWLKADGTSAVEVTFSNYPYGHILVTKVDSLTNKPLANARFKVIGGDGSVIGNTTGEFVTDENGQFLVENIKPQTVTITEIEAPENYAIDTTPQTVNVGTDGKTYKVSFKNKPFGNLVIKKFNKATNEPLANAEFFVTDTKGAVIGDGNGYFVTDNQGVISIPNLDKQSLIVKETKSPDGFILEQQTQTINIEYGKTHTLNFYNTPKSGLQIVKIDADTKMPLKDAKFKVYHMNNELLGEYQTDGNGLIILENLSNGWYKIYESQAPEGFLIDDTPRDVEVKGNQFLKLTFENKKMTGLVIKKIDEDSKIPLSGVHFRVEKQNSELIYEGETDENGLITIPELAPDFYVIRETKEKDGYVSNNQSKVVEVKTGTPTLVTITNKKLGGLQIRKVDQDNAPLSGVHFSVEKMNGEKVSNDELITDNDGLIFLPDLVGDFVIRETRGKYGYKIDGTPRNTTVNLNELKVEKFINIKLGGLQIKKTDQDNNPLSNVVFTVETMTGEKVANGTGSYEHVTDNDGLIFISDLDGNFIIREIKGKDGYKLETASRNTSVKLNEITVEKFVNEKLVGLQIRKVDQDNAPLSGVHFSVEKMNGEKVSNDELITDNDGLIFLPDLVGDFVIRETKGKDGYKIDGTPRNTTVKLNELKVEKFINTKLGGLQIKKTDQNNNPLSNVVFTVETMTGEKVPSGTGNYEHVTDNDGLIFISDIEGNFIIREIKGKDGYKLETAPRNTSVRLNEITVEKFVNEKLGGLQIRKVDQDNAPLSGVHFSVEKMNGEKVSNDELITDNEGLIFLPDLVGDFVIRETKGKDGYKIDGTPRNTTVKLNELKVEKFINTKLGGLQIKKINSVTHEPIENVEFTIKKFNGELVGVYKTGKDGLLFVPDLNGIYTYQETKAADGFIADKEPQTIEVKLGELKTEIVENTPASSLFIKKTDMHTKKPLMGVKFEVTKENGEKIGVFETDRNGYIYVNDLPSGKYKVFELEQLNGYELDTKVYDVMVKKGEQTKLEIQNKKLAGLKIKKIDSITKKGIQNVEFMVFDADGKAVGNFYTDNNGIIDFAGILAEDRYTLRETRPAENYYNDDIPRTVEFIAGKYTEIVWENQPMAGQIQITKLSADANEVSGLEAGTPLEGAIFGVYEYKSGNIVDRFVTGYDGKGVSKPLPLGRYLVKEEQSPPYYKLNKKELDITIEFATQIVKLEFTNESANIGVSIDKVAPKEVMPNQEIRYDIKRIRNDSVVNLTDFYMRDSLPIDAVRLEKIVTGTFNQSLKYKITANTNKGNNIVIADNLMTTKNNVIDCYSSSLGLANDEFVTSFTFYFGNVKAGFCNVEETKIYAKTLNKAFPNGYRFSNRVDVGGKTGGEWVIGNSTVTTTIYSPTAERLPKTGN